MPKVTEINDMKFKKVTDENKHLEDLLKSEIAEHVDAIDAINEKMNELDNEALNLIRTNNKVVDQLNEVQENMVQKNDQLDEVQKNVDELTKFKETFGDVEELVNSMKAIASNNKKQIKK